MPFWLAGDLDGSGAADNGERNLRRRPEFLFTGQCFQQREALLKNRSLLYGTTAFLAVLASAVVAQQVMTNGLVTKVDESTGTIRIQYTQPGTVGGSSSDVSEDFKVSAGLMANAPHPGDKVQFTVEQTDGAKTITKLERQ